MHHEAKDRDPVWDCTLIRVMRNHGDTVLSPIYNWTTADIWDYIRQNNIHTNPLYECGYARVGCIGCPLATYKGRLKEFSDYPKYKGMYISAFDRMLLVRKERNMTVEWESGAEVFDWWIEEYKYNVKGQITMDEYMSESIGG